MFIRTVSLIIVLFAMILIVIVQSERTQQVASVASASKAKFPSLMDEEASQWLSTRNVPRRWRHPHGNQQTSEADQTLQQLKQLNDNGVRQFDSQSFEGVSMEVIFEMVYKQQHGSG